MSADEKILFIRCQRKRCDDTASLPHMRAARIQDPEQRLGAGATIVLQRRCVLVQNRRPISKRKDYLCQLAPLSTSVSTPSIPKNIVDGVDSSPRASSTQTTCKL